uniref:Putative methyltransferase n=1 Tax=viral metagenome TaxID=1070528 RepID=A0A6M3LX04_9ZZZZ
MEVLLEEISEIITMIPIDFLVFSGRNPRTEMRSLEELADSIRKHGVLQPILVTPKEEKFEVVAGERRVRASEMAGLREVPAIIRHLTTKQTDIIRLIENIQRDDLTNVEKGDSVISYSLEYDIMFKEIAVEVGVPYSTLKSWLRVSRKVSDKVKRAIQNDLITDTHARWLAKYDNLTQDRLLELIIKHKLTPTENKTFTKLYDGLPGSNLDDLALQAKGFKTVSKIVPIEEEKTTEEVKKVIEEKIEPRALKEEVKNKISDTRRNTHAMRREARERMENRQFEEPVIPPIMPFKLRREEKLDQALLLEPHEPPELEEVYKLVVPEDVKRSILERPELEDFVEELSKIEDPEKRKRMTKATIITLEDVKERARKRLERFPEKSRLMQPKFARLEELQKKGIILHTIWDFRYRDDYAGYRDFVSNCSPQLVEQCILRFTDEEDLVIDPMVGSGTTIDVCRAFNRRCIGYDIKPVRSDIIKNDARKLPLENNYVDMIFIHPPYWNLATYTKADENLPDLSRTKTFEEFLEMLSKIFEECYRVLKNGKYICVLLGDMVREGRYYPICRKATKLAEDIGFEDCGYAIKIAHGEVSRKKSGVIFAELAYINYLKIAHDLIMFYRKPDNHGK